MPAAPSLLTSSWTFSVLAKAPICTANGPVAPFLGAGCASGEALPSRIAWARCCSANATLLGAGLALAASGDFVSAVFAAAATAGVDLATLAESGFLAVFSSLL